MPSRPYYVYDSSASREEASVLSDGDEQYERPAWLEQRLEGLREEYPHREWTDDGREWSALRFLKWRIEKGNLSE